MADTTNENISALPIDVIDAEVENAIKRKSAEPLPINPGAKGMKAEDIRKALYAPIIDEKQSVLAELKRVIGQANTAFGAIEAAEEEQKKQINNKVEKEDGKGLSSNDFTDEYKEKVDNFDKEISLPSWIEPERPKYTASEVGAATPDEVASAVANERTAREAEDTAIGLRILNEETARTNADTALDEKISAEQSAREEADTSIRESIAANKSSIDVLNGSASTEGSVKKQIADAIAAIMENPDTSINSIQELVDWVNDHASDALELSNKASANEAAIGKINALLGTSLPTTTNASTVIGYITEIADKLATETSERKAADINLQKNIDAEATARADAVSLEASARTNADNAIKSAAVGTPTVSGQELIFPNLNGTELTRVTLPSGSGSSSASGNGVYVPLQVIEGWYMGSALCDCTEVRAGVYSAKVVLTLGTYTFCGGYYAESSLTFYSNGNSIEIINTPKVSVYTETDYNVHVGYGIGPSITIRTSKFTYDALIEAPTVLVDITLDTRADACVFEISDLKSTHYAYG